MQRTTNAFQRKDDTEGSVFADRSAYFERGLVSSSVSSSKSGLTGVRGGGSSGSWVVRSSWICSAAVEVIADELQDQFAGVVWQLGELREGAHSYLDLCAPLEKTLAELDIEDLGQRQANLLHAAGDNAEKLRLVLQHDSGRREFRHAVDLRQPVAGFGFERNTRKILHKPRRTAGGTSRIGEKSP